MTTLQTALLAPTAAAAALMLVYGTVIGLTRFFFVGTKKWTYADITPGHSHGPRWYSSLNRVYINSIESFALFFPALMLHLVRGPTELVGTLAWAYVGFRVLYSLVYVVGGYKIAVSFSWLGAWGITIVLWLLALMG